MEVLDYTREYSAKTNGVIIYGAGVWGKIVYETLQGWNVTPRYFVDRFKCNYPSSDSLGYTSILPPNDLSEGGYA